jgi:hypothetical protein
VKAELKKLGEAPRAYLEKLQMAESMSIDSAGDGTNSAGGKLSISQRFEAI